MKLVGDFETTTYLDDENRTRVWASCLVDIDTLNTVGIWNNIDDFMKYLSNKNTEVYFHNLKFDGEFIIHWLLTHGFTLNDSKESNTFQTSITDLGIFYSITVYFKTMNKRYHKVVFYDSLKKLPLKVSQIAGAFELEESKLIIDYKAEREIGHVLTKEEEEYIKADCIIVAKALKTQFEKGLTKMTVGSDAMADFKMRFGEKKFEKYFPVFPLEMDADLRQAYKGGFTWLNKKYANQRIKSGLVYDVNSLYPSVMYDCPLPYYYPIYFEGEYEQDDEHPLYIQRLQCSFELKEGYIPTIQLKNNYGFNGTEYLESSRGEIVDMVVTSVDLKLMKEHYILKNEHYISGFKFKAHTGFFKEYIDYWGEVKKNSTGGMRQLAKLMLNNLYGKFGTNPRDVQKLPYLDEDGKVCYKYSDETFREPIYIPMACFITAWARYKTITSAQALYDRIIYCDTDSLHIVGTEVPDNIEIHPKNLGCWAHEATFTDSKFLRAKTYMETIDGVPHVTCAGMPENVKATVTYDTFTYGAVFGGKLTPRRHKGGIILEETNFTIKT